MPNATNAQTPKVKHVLKQQQGWREGAADLVRLELLHHVVEQSIVKVLASQEGVSVGGLHLKHTTCIIQQELKVGLKSIDMHLKIV